MDGMCKPENAMDERQKVTNYRTVGHPLGLWMPKVQILLFFSAFGCFCLLVGYMLLMFWYSLERIPCWLCNGLLMEMRIMMVGGEFLRH
jgi:hypothetical protein